MCVPGCSQAIHRALSRRSFFGGAAAAGFAATSVAPANAALPQSRSFSAVVDLTHTMSADFPTFFGTPGIEMQRQSKFKRDGFNAFWWRVNEHSGTHMDAPIHFSETGLTADKIPADQLVAPLAVIDVTQSAARNADYALSRADLDAWERRHGRLPAGCCVAMHSGWGDLLASDPAKFLGRDVDGDMHFPGFSGEATQWLATERSVIGIASDTLSLDPGVSKEFKAHTAWLPTGRWGLENVANLGKVPAVGATLVVGIPKIQGATGGPVRLMALV